MTVKRIDPEGWYEYEGSSVVVCGRCVQDDLNKTAAGLLVDDEIVTMDMVNELSLDEGAYQCEDCLEQSENYDDESSED